MANIEMGPVQAAPNTADTNRSSGNEELIASHPPTPANDDSILPTHNEKPGSSRDAGGLFRVSSAGESGRRGIHPLHFLLVCFKSTCTLSMLVNVLWPFVPAAIALHFARPDLHVVVFSLNYIAMVPSANLLGFAGGELAKKLPKVLGVLVETTLSSVVEVVLFMVLLSKDQGGDMIIVIQAAILGSVLANLLLCLGTCFFFGGLRREEQVFHEAISEVGSGLLLVAGFGLMIPSAFFSALSGSTGPHFTAETLMHSTLKISRATSVILLFAFVV
jgi:Ca2+:H+ antiporter